MQGFQFVLERLDAKIQQEMQEWRTQFVPQLEMDELIELMNHRWTQKQQEMPVLFEQAGIKTSTFREWLYTWFTGIALLHEWVVLYDLAKEKVKFADVFGLYYRSQSMIEPDAMIHPKRWVNRFLHIERPVWKEATIEDIACVNELLRRACTIWKSPIPEQQWIVSWLFLQIEHFPEGKTVVSHWAPKSTVTWFGDFNEGNDGKVKETFNKLSPLIRCRNVSLIIFLLHQEREANHQRIFGWLQYALKFLSFISAPDAENIWIYFERWAIYANTQDQIDAMIKALFDHLPSTKQRLIAVSEQTRNYPLRIEVELLTNGDPMEWSSEEWDQWIESRAEFLLPFLHNRLDQIMKWKASDRETAMEWTWNALQTVYTKLDRELLWKQFISWYDEQYGRTRVGRTLREKEQA